MKENTSSQGLRTGELAARAGVNIQTLRFYERRGLLEEPPRQESGYREYPTDAVQLVRFIKRAQGLGFSLQEIQDLLSLRGEGGVRCSDVRQTAEEKMAEIDSKVKQLGAMKRALAQLVDSCRRRRSDHCPLLESLDDESEGAGKTVAAVVGPRPRKAR